MFHQERVVVLLILVALLLSRRRALLAGLKGGFELAWSPGHNVRLLV